MADFDFCLACGQKVVKGAMRCIRCGQALMTLEEQLERVEKLKEGEKDGSALSLVGLLVLVLVAGVVYLLFSGLRLEIISALFTD